MKPTHTDRVDGLRSTNDSCMQGSSGGVVAVQAAVKLAAARPASVQWLRLAEQRASAAVAAREEGTRGGDGLRRPSGACRKKKKGLEASKCVTPQC